MLRNRPRFLIAIALCGVVIGIAILYIQNSAYPEVREISSVSLSTDEYANYFEQLAKEKGSSYAFEVLRRAAFPAGVNVHSVAHPIGYVLFDEQGIRGIRDCTQEFRNACAHSIVIQSLLTFGPQALNEMEALCKDVPGGEGGYATCFHGVGHGLVVYLEFNFPEAVRQCEAFKNDTDGILTRRFMDPWQECIGGAVMEFIQGTHDREVSVPAQALYAPDEDPFMPCTADFMWDDAPAACYLSLTQRFFVAVGALEEVPSPDTYPNAMKYCEEVDDAYERSACFGGFGKEYVFYATQRDGGDVNLLSDTALTDIHSWCAFANEPAGSAYCRSIALDSLFWTGVNNPASATSFCRLAPEKHMQDECYTDLIENGTFFLEGANRDKLCRLMPEPYRFQCLE